MQHATEGGGFGPVLGVYRDMCDVSDDDSVRKFFENVPNLDAAGSDRLFVVNATGKCVNGLCRKYTESHLDDMIGSNVKSCFLITKHFHRACLSRPGSALLLLSSVVSLTGVAGASAYGMCKAAVSGLVRSACKEYARDGLRINCLRLGYYKTGMIRAVPEEMAGLLIDQTPSGKFGDMNDLWGAVEFCLTNEFLTGTTVDVNGGLA